MSAVVCGKRSSFFEDLQSSSSPTPVSKRIRCSSSSPVRFSPPRPTATTTTGSPSSQSHFCFPSRSSLLDYLSARFPHMDKQLLEKALEVCGDDLDSAIRSLNELRLGSAETLGAAAPVEPGTAHDANVQFEGQQGMAATNGDLAATEDSLTPQNLPMDGAEWVELFVREMMSASNMDDAKARASRALEVLEKSICSRTTADVAQSFQQENIVLKEQLEALAHENTILKRAVSIQHERQKEFEDKSHELHHLKQMVSQYQEQLRTLEVNNYALTMHLKQAQQNNSIAGRFHPDVF